MEAVRESAIPGLIAQLLRLPLSRMLLLSLCLHLAVVMIVQPQPYPPVPEVVVISARLNEPAAPAPTPAPTPAPAVAAPPLPAPVPEVASKPAPEAPLPKPEPAPAQETAPARVAVSAAPAAVPRAVEAPALPSLPVMVDTTWYEARQLDSQPRATAPIQPRYPPAAQKRGTEGSVKLRLRVDEYGVVQEAEVEEGDPPGVFDESALAAFKAGRFVPARKDGRPVRAQIYIRVRYDLDD